jgi:hypothetical protein
MNFYQQETFRDRIRLKFNLETVIQKLNSFNSCCKFFVDLNTSIYIFDITQFIVEFLQLKDIGIESAGEIVLKSIKNVCITMNRSQHVMFDNLSQFVAGQKKYEKKVVRSEELIDDCYSSEKYQFKYTIQTEKWHRNMINDFLQFKSFLVSINFLHFVFKIIYKI